MWTVVIIILITALLGLIWSFHHYSKLQQIPIHSGHALMEDEIHFQEEKSSSTMSAVQIGAIIQEGATEFIVSEYKICFVFVLLMSVIVFFCVD
jgi:hypothetical protein